jgi:hypothetical protein
MEHQETASRREEGFLNEVISPGLLLNCDTVRVGGPNEDKTFNPSSATAFEAMLLALLGLLLALVRR